ncbi:MAG: hypothetical protein ACOYNF_02420 [Rhodoferax sp.]
MNLSRYSPPGITAKGTAQYDYISAGKTSGNRLLQHQALAGVPGKPQSMYDTRQHNICMTCARKFLTFLG